MERWSRSKQGERRRGSSGRVHCVGDPEVSGGVPYTELVARAGGQERAVLALSPARPLAVPCGECYLFGEKAEKLVVSCGILEGLLFQMEFSWSVAGVSSLSSPLLFFQVNA